VRVHIVPLVLLNEGSVNSSAPKDVAGAGVPVGVGVVVGVDVTVDVGVVVGVDVTVDVGVGVGEAGIGVGVGVGVGDAAAGVPVGVGVGVGEGIGALPPIVRELSTGCAFNAALTSVS
tara:strand:- start:1237 stop:1590 length:354 start_codon:yes stop_codon:yes gene_type:complete